MSLRLRASGSLDNEEVTTSSSIPSVVVLWRRGCCSSSSSIAICAGILLLQLLKARETCATDQSAKPVTFTQDAPHGGLSIRWGTFSLRELAQFKDLLEKPIRLKPIWLDNDDMAT
ncbi:hypothetical protein V6Z11_D12G147400 [Gossypium hirsutum]